MPDPSALVDGLLTEKEAASRLRARPSTLRAWRSKKIGPPYVRVGKLVRYRASEIEAYIVAETVATMRVRPEVEDVP